MSAAGGSGKRQHKYDDSEEHSNNISNGTMDIDISSSREEAITVERRRKIQHEHARERSFWVHTRL